MDRSYRVCHPLLALLLGTLLLPSAGPAQPARVRALGGITLGLQDPDLSLNPYDFAGNPAWLVKDETVSWLKVLPAAAGQWGTLHRAFDPAKTASYGAGFDGVKTLGEKGTFRGIASYDVEVRRDVYRSLNRYPYAGEAFFVTDTTTGDFTYSGPSIQFLYSYEIVPSVAVGASVRYQIQNGLKEIYSRATSLYRDLQARLGVTWEAREDLVLGLTVEPRDNQESIEAKSEESFEVEVFNFRGDTYAVRHRGASVEHKVRKDGLDLTGTIFSRPSPGLEIAAAGGLGSSRTRILVPKGLDLEVVEGLARPTQWNARLQARYEITGTVTLGATAAYHHTRVWSQHSALGLLLWDWTRNELGAGIGASWRAAPGFLLGGEYAYARMKLDSLKYIDGATGSQRPVQHLVRAGVEYEASPGLLLRAGGSYRYASHDLCTGAARLTGLGVSAGAGVKLGESAVLDLFFEYGSAAPRSARSAARASAAGGVNLKLLSL